MADAASNKFERMSVKYGVTRATDKDDNMAAQDSAGPPTRSHVDVPKMKPEDFTLVKQIGMGSSARVFLVRKKTGVDAGKLYAMKTDNKIHVTFTKIGSDHTKAERDVILDTNHRSVVNLFYAFIAADKLYRVMEYMSGGDLRTWLRRDGPFQEPVVRICLAEITVAIEHLHSEGVAHRDLKPSNILIDAQGHIKLADFGLCRDSMYHGTRIPISKGHIEYMAPEMVDRSSQVGREVDWWSMGAIMYEMFTGKTPFVDEDDRSSKQTAENIVYAIYRTPSNISKKAKDLLENLLRKDWEKRIGYGSSNADPIKRHQFFHGTDWLAVWMKTNQAAFEIQLANETDVRYFGSDFTFKKPIDYPANRSWLTEADYSKLKWLDFSYVAACVLEHQTGSVVPTRSSSTGSGLMMPSTSKNINISFPSNESGQNRSKLVGGVAGALVESDPVQPVRSSSLSCSSVLPDSDDDEIPYDIQSIRSKSRFGKTNYQDTVPPTPPMYNNSPITSQSSLSGSVALPPLSPETEETDQTFGGCSKSNGGDCRN